MNDKRRYVTLETESEGVKLIAKERERQVEYHRWSAAHDDGHTDQVIAVAAAVYAMPFKMRENQILGRSLRHIFWPWQGDFRGATQQSPTDSERIHELTKAGALIAAEIDRLTRKGAG